LRGGRERDQHSLERRVLEALDEVPTVGIAHRRMHALLLVRQERLAADPDEVVRIRLRLGLQQGVHFNQQIDQFVDRQFTRDVVERRIGASPGICDRFVIRRRSETGQRQQRPVAAVPQDARDNVRPHHGCRGGLASVRNEGP